jgi:hypothetical protein
MNDENTKEPTVLHVEVAVAILVAGVTLVGGLLATVWFETWTPAVMCAIVACGLVFTAACIPQIKAAVARQSEQRK